MAHSDAAAVMTHASLVIAPQTGVRDAGTAKGVVRRMRELFAAIEARGHTVAMLAPDAPWSASGHDAEVVRMIEEEAPGNVRRVKMVTERDAYFVLWPKDGFCDWGEFIAAADAPGFAALTGAFGKPVRTDEALAEGGLFVRTDQHVLASSACSDDAAFPDRWRIVRLPHPYSSDLYRRHQPEHQPLTHLDLDLALIPCGKSPLLLVSERYLYSYREFVAAAADRLGLKVVGISQVEAASRGLNLVVLSERAVLIPAECPQIFGLLADRLGADSIIEVRIDDVFNYNGGRGGLGCMSNIVRQGMAST